MDSTSMAIEIAVKIDRLLNQGRGGEALVIYRQTLLKSDVTIKNLIILSQIASARGRFDEALAVAENILAKRTRHPEGLVEAAGAAFQAGRNELALKYAKYALKVCKRAELLNTIGKVFFSLNKAPMALKAFERALELDANEGETHVNLADTLVAVGRFEEAEAHYDKSIKLGAGNYANYLNRSRLKNQTDASNHISELENLKVDERTSMVDQVYLNYALAKEYEDLGQFEESFSTLEQANSILRERTGYVVERDSAAHDAIIESHDEEFSIMNLSGEGRHAPIFIVGMPRSGTSLVEAILCSHSEVSSAGEPRVFGRIIERLITVDNPSPNVRSQTELVQLSKTIDFERAGRAYLEMTTPLASGTSRYTDKLPGNYLYCGLIGRALPNAKIIHVRRNPMDGCFAIFKQLFMGRYQFSYDQKTLAQYYVAYLRVMDHFEAMAGDRLYTIHYEDLVADQENETRKLIGACNLEWQDNCLHQDKASRAVLTASAIQVRQPIYESSVLQWKKYEAQLQPLKEALEQEGINPEI